MVEYSGEIFMRVYKGNSCAYIMGEIFVCVNVCEFFMCEKAFKNPLGNFFSDITPTKSLKIKDKMETVLVSTI